jgi:hypothetical protein
MGEELSSVRRDHIVTYLVYLELEQEIVYRPLSDLRFRERGKDVVEYSRGIEHVTVTRGCPTRTPWAEAEHRNGSLL